MEHFAGKINATLQRWTEYALDKYERSFYDVISLSQLNTSNDLIIIKIYISLIFISVSTLKRNNWHGTTQI